jgi:hypothetical protein
MITLIVSSTITRLTAPKTRDNDALGRRAELRVLAAAAAD